MHTRIGNTRVLTLATVAMATLAFTATPASAAALVYEGFEYAAGSLNGKSGGTGWGANAWTNDKNGHGDVALPGNTYGALTVVGGKAGDNFNPGPDDSLYWGSTHRLIGTDLSNAGLLDNGATLWFSVIADGSNAGGTSKLGFAIGNGKFGNSDTVLDGGGDGVGFWGSNRADKVSASMWNSGSLDNTPDSGAASIPVTSVPLIVGKIEWGAAAADETLTLYTPDAALNQGAAVAVNSMSDVDQSTFDQVTLLYKEGTYMDEIRFAGTYAEVVGLEAPSAGTPEPSTLLLAALGLVGLVGMRRRRR